MGKTNPLNDADLAEFVTLQQSFGLGARSWVVDALTLDPASYDLSVKNPNAPEEAPLREPAAIIEDMLARDVETAEILASIRGML